MNDKRKSNKTVPSKIQNNHLMAITYYVKVKNIPKPGEEIIVDELDAGTNNIQVKGAELLKNCLSADLYESESNCSRTDLLHVMVTSYNRPMTVCFTKLNGDKRILRGRFVDTIPLEGRTFMEDLDINKSENRLREVDNRTVEWLIVDGVKYTVKKR